MHNFTQYCSTVSSAGAPQHSLRKFFKSKREFYDLRKDHQLEHHVKFYFENWKS